MVKVADDAYDVPEPFATVFQPANVYPVRVGTVADTVTVAPKFTDDPDGAPEPLFASYDTLYELIDHCANSVTSAEPMTNDDGENAVPFHAYDVPEPFAAVFQPANVYPVRVGRVEEIVTVAPKFTDADDGAPEPLFASYTTL